MTAITEEKSRWENLPDVLTVQEAANILRIHFNTVKRLLNLGKLPGRKVGRQWRIDRDDLKQFIDKKEV
jgi:excisionase family DNA binding protein